MARKNTMRKKTQTTKKHAIIYLSVTTLGICLGICGDFIFGQSAPTIEDISAAILLSLFLIPFAGDFIPLSTPWMFKIGGILFWPLWFVLSYYYFYTGKNRYVVALLLWYTQGFLCIVHRLWALSSV